MIIIYCKRAQFNNLFKNINCPQVCSRYKFQICTFIFSDEQNPRKLYEIASQILRFPRSFETMRFKDEFQQLMHRIQKDPNFLRTYPEIIEKIIKVLLQFNQGYRPQGTFITSYNIENMMYRYSLLNFFLQFRPFIGSEHLQQILQRLEKEPPTISEQRVLTALELINYFLHLSINYDIMGLPLKKIQAFENIYRLSVKIRNQKLILFSLKNIIKIATFEDFKDYSLNYTLFFYSFSQDVPSCARYFQSGHNYLITVTLFELHKGERIEDFYYFLMLLAKYVTRFPTKEVILEWSDNMNMLIRQGGFLQLMRYELLSTKTDGIFWDNRYYVCYYAYSLQIEQKMTIILKICLKIAENINFLRTNAKEAVLPIFFKSIISQFQSKKRKFAYLTLRWGYKYLKRHEFLQNMKINSFKFGKKERNGAHNPKTILREKVLGNLSNKKPVQCTI